METVSLAVAFLYQSRRERVATLERHLIGPSAYFRLRRFLAFTGSSIKRPPPLMLIPERVSRPRQPVAQTERERDVTLSGSAVSRFLITVLR